MMIIIRVVGHDRKQVRIEQPGIVINGEYDSDIPSNYVRAIIAIGQSQLYRNLATTPDFFKKQRWVEIKSALHPR